MAVLVLGAASPAQAGCGCDKPPPPPAAIRPFFGYANQMITLFDRRLARGKEYEVRFTSTTDGSVDWSRGRAVRLRDLADRRRKVQLSVPVGEVALGPCTVSVWRKKKLLYTIEDNRFTVIGPPISLHDFEETVAQPQYAAAVGKDGTIYLTVDVANVSDATTFRGSAKGFPLRFKAENVSMYNLQGYLMQLLDPQVPGLFRITTGDSGTSNTLAYGRHEFHTYKREHRQLPAREPDRRDPNWHRDGTPHIDHDIIVVAIAGTLGDGVAPTPGSTRPFDLSVKSSKKPVDQNDDDGHGDDGNDGDGHGDDGNDGGGRRHRGHGDG